MSQKSIINDVRASGEDIHNLVTAIETMCDGVSKPHLVIACIALALSLQYPDISPEDRVEGVQDISRYMCLWVDTKIEPIEDLVIN